MKLDIRDLETLSQARNFFMCVFMHVPCMSAKKARNKRAGAFSALAFCGSNWVYLLNDWSDVKK